MSSAMLEFSEIGRVQLQSIAESLSLDKNKSNEELSIDCFDKCFQHAQSGHWERIDPFTDQLSSLLDRVGRSLLVKALFVQNDKVAKGLIDRKIGLTTKDRYNHTVMDYLAMGIAGNRSDEYAKKIYLKMHVGNNQQTTSPYNSDQLLLLKNRILEISLAKDIEKKTVSRDQAIRVIKNSINKNKLLFSTPIILNFKRILVDIQSASNSPEVSSAKENYVKSHILSYGFKPEYTKNELLGWIDSQNDEEIEMFFSYCQFHFSESPHRINHLINLLLDVGDQYEFQNRQDRTVKALKNILTLPKTIQEMQPELFADTYRRVGLLQIEDRRKYTEVEVSFKLSLDLCHRFLPPDNTIRVLCENAAVSLDFFVRHPAVEQKLRKIIENAERLSQLPHPYFLAELYSRLASVLLRKEDYEEALKYAQKGKFICDEKNAINDRRAVNIYFSTIGTLTQILNGLNKQEEALQVQQAFLSLLEIQGNNLPMLAKATLDLGNILMNLKRYTEALDSYTCARMIAKQNSDLYARIQAATGSLLLDMEKFDEAIPFSQEAARVFGELQSSLPHQNWRLSIFEEHVRAFLEWEIGLVYSGKTKEALLVADQRRARVLSFTLSNKLFPNEPPTVELTLPEIFNLAKELDTTFVVYSLFKSNTDGVCWVITQNNEIHSEMFSLKNICPDGIDKLLVSPPYRTKEGDSEVNEEKKEEKSQNLPNLRMSFDELKQKIKEERRQKVHHHLKTCYQHLIQPIEKYLPNNQTITFVPEGVMTRLPFAIFEKTDGTYFIQDHPTLLTPSIKSLSLLNQLKKLRAEKPLSENSVVVGNPNTKAGRLLFAEVEATEVGKLLNTSSENLLVGDKAKIVPFLSLIQKAKWIHCACHGSAKEKEDDNSVYRGLLNFTPENNQDPLDKGELYANKLSSLDLKAELAFLAACYSGTGNDTYVHEGLIGLTHALASSGVLSSLTSYWKLPENQATVDLVINFYKIILDTTQPRTRKATALQQAMLKAMAINKDNPDEWGALFLTGLDT